MFTIVVEMTFVRRLFFLQEYCAVCGLMCCCMPCFMVRVAIVDGLWVDGGLLLGPGTMVNVCRMRTMGHIKARLSCLKSWNHRAKASVVVAGAKQGLICRDMHSFCNLFKK